MVKTSDYKKFLARKKHKMEESQTPSSQTVADSQDDSPLSSQTVADSQEGHRLSIWELSMPLKTEDFHQLFDHDETPELENELAQVNRQMGIPDEYENHSEDGVDSLYSYTNQIYAKYKYMEAALHLKEEDIKWYRSCYEEEKAKEAKREELQNAFAKQSRKLENAWKFNDEILEELEKAKNSDKHFLLGDDTIMSKWKSLCYLIRNTAHHVFNKPVNPDCLMDGMPFFEETSSRWKDYLRPKENVPLLVGAVIWRCISSRYLRLPLNAYATHAGQALHELQTKTRDNKEELRRAHEWRSFTGETFHIMIGADEKYKKSAARELSSLLVHCSNMGKRERRQALEEIVAKAQDLACIFARSRAYYQVWDGPPEEGDDFTADGFPLDVERMDECGGDGSGRVVDMVLSPALIKHGNAEGQDYDEYLVLAKAEVVSRR